MQPVADHNVSQTRSDDRSAVTTPPGDHAPADVLVIDDDPAIVDLFTSLLVCEEDLTVHGACSAASALAWTPPTPPAVVFLDLTVPGERAAQTIRALRARPGWARVPVVICSGVEKPALPPRAFKDVDYLAKPFDLDAVASLARGYVSTQRAQRAQRTRRNPHPTQRTQRDAESLCLSSLRNSASSA